MSRLPSLALMLFLLGCASNGQRIDRLAESAGLTRALVESEGYRSLIYMKRAPATSGRGFVVFLEGDGRPWQGREPSDEPTTRDPIALRLLLQTPRAGAYVTRPCYHGLQTGDCTPEQWTSGRYSQRIVSSMAGAVREAARRAAAEEIILVGYSGGGALAVLIAERLDKVAAVVTIAANLDIDAWAASRHFLPLTQSLNPAKSARPHPWPEIHLHGARDAAVPPTTSNAYFQRHPSARREIIDRYDHVCCWVDDWSALFGEIKRNLE